MRTVSGGQGLCSSSQEGEATAVTMTDHLQDMTHPKEDRTARGGILGLKHLEATGFGVGVSHEAEQPLAVIYWGKKGPNAVADGF